MVCRYRFDRFELRPTEHVLLANGQALAIGKRAIELLLALIEGRDRTLSKEELLDRVWPRLDVEENNLAMQISTLRRVLGPRAVDTVSGVGYRFAMPVLVVDVAPAALPAAEQAPPESPAQDDLTAVLRFGAFEWRPAQRQALLGDRTLAVGSRAFDVLAVLIEQRHRVVSKRELLERVWPGLVVEENNLQVQVSTLRKLLGPSAVATVPGRGYRFVLAMDAEIAAAERVRLSVDSLPSLPEAVHGRDDDLVALEALLQRHRLLTVSGAGGIGKTTLAVMAAQARRLDWPHGVAWIDLAPVTDPLLIPQAVARALGLSPGGPKDWLTAIVDALRPLQVLIVFDNAEHLVGDVAKVAEAVLAGAPGARLLVTSQAVLKVASERVFRLGGLGVPESDTPADEALKFGSVALFVDQAKAVDRAFELTNENVATVIDLCRHLDGLPLALKLAAARLRLFGLRGLEARLAERFKLLGGGNRTAPTRQQTLRAALDWSYQLLTPREQAVFRGLGVFAGSFGLELAVAVVSQDEAAGADPWELVDTVDALVDRSLVALDAADPPRLRLLESAREYALLELDNTQSRQALERRHAQIMLAQCERAQAEYWQAGDQKRWAQDHGSEIDNLRAALDWACLHAVPMAAALTGAASQLFGALSLMQEYRRRCERLDPLIGADVAEVVAAKYWLERSRMMLDTADGAKPSVSIEAIRLYRGIDDREGLYKALGYAVIGAHFPVAGCAAMVEEMGALEQACWPFALRHVRMVAEVVTLQRERHFARACAVVQQMLAQARAGGLDGWVAVDLNFLADMTLAAGDAVEAVRLAREALAIDRARRSQNILHTLATLTTALLALEAVAEARTALAEFLAESRQREWDQMDMKAGLYARLAALDGRLPTAAKLLGFAGNMPRPAAEKFPNEAIAAQQAWLAVSDGLPAPTVERLLAEGAALSRDAVVALTLADSEAETKPG